MNGLDSFMGLKICKSHAFEDAHIAIEKELSEWLSGFLTNDFKPYSKAIEAVYICSENAIYMSHFGYNELLKSFEKQNIYRGEL